MYGTQELLNLFEDLTRKLDSLRDIEHELKINYAMASVEGLRALLASKLPPSYEELCKVALSVCEEFGAVEMPRSVWRLRELARGGLALVERRKGDRDGT